MNVNLKRVDTTVLEKHLALLDITPEGKDIKTKVDALVGHYRAHKDEIKFAVCDACGGYSDAELAECPFCGDTEAVEGGEAAPIEAPKAAPKSESNGKATKRKKRSETIGKHEANDPVHVTTPMVRSGSELAKKKKASRAKKVSAREAAKGKIAKKKKKIAVKAARQSTEVKVADSAEIAFTIADLNRECKVIRKSTQMAASNLYRMGQAFVQIVDNNLWKLRRGDDGKPKHTNFRRFCADEFGISYGYAYSLMEVTKRFSEDQIAELGVSKLKLALSVPDDRQEEMIDAARGGALRDDLSDKARSIREGMDGDDAPTPTKAITVALIQGPQVVPAFKRPTKPGKSGKATVPATALSDDPWGVLELDNDVSIHIRTSVNPDGEIEFVIEAKRGKRSI